MIPEVLAFPAIKVPKKDPQLIPAEAFEKLFEKAADRQMQAYLLCGWLGGLRLSEALALEWEYAEKAPYLDLQRSRIVLPAEFVKADKDQWVPLDPVLRQALEVLPVRGRKVFFFPGRHGEPLGPGGVSQNVTALAKKAGVRLSMHSLRKGFGCRYAGKVPAQVLQKLMRPANIKTTMDYYANVDAAVEEAVLGPKCNTSRNKATERVAKGDEGQAVNPCEDSANCSSTN